MFVIREITPCQHLAPLSFVRTVLDCCAAGNGAKRSCAFWMAALRSSPQRDLRNKDLPFRIKRVQNSQEKVGRIQACEPRIKAIRFPRAHHSMFPGRCASCSSSPVPGMMTSRQFGGLSVADPG